MRRVLWIVFPLLIGCASIARTWDTIGYDSFQSSEPEEEPPPVPAADEPEGHKAYFPLLVFAVDVLARASGREHAWPAYDPADPDRVGYFYGRWQQSR